MNISKLKINLFFLTLVLLGWFLYPKTLFLGYLFEGEADLNKSEAFYLEYLSSRPHSKKAILRLAHLYERKGEPEKGVRLLAGLVDYRKNDWELARVYLTYLEDSHALDDLYKARVQIAERMMTDRRLPRHVAEGLLSDAFEYALWKQQYEDAYGIMLKLLQYGASKKDYEANLETLDWGLKHTKQLLNRYEFKVANQPNDINALSELISLYRVLDRQAEALALIDLRLKTQPKNIEMLLLKSYIDEDLNRKNELITTLESIIAFSNKDQNVWLEASQRLISLLVESKQYSKALDLAKQVLNSNEDLKDNWFLVSSILEESKQYNELMAFLDRFEVKFPDDSSSHDLRLNIWLYEQKDLSHLEFYKDYVKQTHKVSVAIDVAFLLKERQQLTDLQRWIGQMSALFPNNEELILIASDYFAQQKKWQEALFWLNKINNPSVEIALNKIYLLINAGQKSKAIEVLQQLSVQTSKKNNLAAIIGREFLFLGHPKKAIDYLKKALIDNPDNSMAHFWLGEAYDLTLNRSLADTHFEKVISLLNHKKSKSSDEEHFYLKSKGRIEGSKKVADLYRYKFEHDSKDTDYKTEWLDILLQERDFNAAQLWLSRFKKTKNVESSRWLPYEIRLAFGLHQYQKASNLLESILKIDSGNAAYRRDLVDAYLKQGNWREAVFHLDKIPKSLDQELQVTSLKRLIHQSYDNSVSFQFDFSDAGGENFNKEVIALRQTIAARVYLLAGLDLGEFDSNFAAASTSLIQGRVGLGGYWGSGWHYEGAFQTAHTGLRDLYSPSLFLESPKDRVWQLGVKAYLSELDTSAASLTTLGDAASGFSLTGNVALTDKVSLTGTLGSSWHKLPSLEESYILDLDAALGYRVLTLPDVSIGYEFKYNKAYDDAWTNQTGFIKEINAHYINVSVSHEIRGVALVDMSAFVGEDFSRDLHFYNADLWGASAGFNWLLYDWLTLSGRYEYGQESLQTTTGNSHRFLMGLSGHWW